MITSDHVPSYPNIRCATHPDEPGYAVCIHIQEGGERVHFVERATPNSLGVIICKSCCDQGAPVCMLKCVCAQCCRSLGWLLDQA